MGGCDGCGVPRFRRELVPRHPSPILRANRAKQHRGRCPMSLVTRAFAAPLLHAAIAVSVAIGVAAVSSSSVLAQQKVALRVAYIPVITWLPALIAKDEGFFDANGLDVTFTKFPNIVNLPATLGRQFDLVPTT